MNKTNDYRYILVAAIFMLSLSYFSFKNNAHLAKNVYTESVISEKKKEIAKSQKQKIIIEGFNNLSTDSSISEIVDSTKSMNDDLIVTIEFKDDFEPKTKRPSFDATLEEINTAIKERREEVKRHFAVTNQKNFLNLNIKDFKEAFISNYSPFVDVKFSVDSFARNDYSKLLEISQDDKVDTLYIKPSSTVYKEEMTSALPSVGLPTPSNIPNLGHNGLDIVVGVLEAGGIVDINHSNISGSNVVVRDEWYYIESVSEHAIRVTSIIGGNTGIARGAQILSVELSGDPKSEVEWMLDRNVNIINNSRSEKDEYKTGDYNSNSAYFDYIVRTNWVTVCASAGNAGNDSGWIGNPGLGFNVITVGASKDNKVLSDFSSFKENFSISKPTLVAPGYDISVPGFPDREVKDDKTYLINCGTSFSSPIVAGTIALLIDEFPHLKIFPECIISLLTASASKMSSIYSNFNASGLEDKVGAGKLNYERAREIIRNNFKFNNSENGQGVRATQKIYLKEGETIRISLAWLTNNNNQTDTDCVTDYDLQLVDSSGTYVSTSMSALNNIEIIDYKVSKTDTYSINVYQFGNKKNTITDFGSVYYSIL